MAKRLRAVIGLTYPADEASLALILSAGGRSKLTAEQRRRVKLKTVPAGRWCDDLPEISRARLIEKGSVVVVDVDDASVDGPGVASTGTKTRTREK